MKGIERINHRQSTINRPRFAAPPSVSSGWFVSRPELKRTSKAYPAVSVIKSLARSEERHHGPDPKSVGVQATTPTFVTGPSTLAKTKRLRLAWEPCVKTLSALG